ncbi:hypothetical protein [Nonomuraea sp. JJY05]|uniref:hypothetical protein n=1 Tax=Nonomuraea sp. JJY05 TaxID=3350255 RepID=UPI00373F4B7A
MLFSIMSNFGEMPTWHQIVFGLAAVAGAVATAGGSGQQAVATCGSDTSLLDFQHDSKKNRTYVTVR